MPTSRWEHLDRQPPAAAEGPAVAHPPAGREHPPEPEPAPSLRAAAALYRLRCYEEAAVAARAALAAEPGLRGAQRLLGLALGQAGEWPAALTALAEAQVEDPADPVPPAALLSGRLAAGETPEPPAGVAGPLGELAGAAAWRAARAAFEADPARAAQAFAAAGAAFAAHSPPEALPERLAACYLAEAIGWLLADRPHAAQQAFGRYAAHGPLPPAALEFARRLYALADTLADVPAAERRAALEPLATLLRDVRHVVAFYDGGAPVGIAWVGLPLT